MDGCGIQGTPIPELLVTASDPVIKEVRREDSPVKVWLIQLHGFNYRYLFGWHSSDS